jgi:Protein of unknown function (DUF4038)/Putative collagen-binding domain of a collagenase
MWLRLIPVLLAATLLGVGASNVWPRTVGDQPVRVDRGRTQPYATAAPHRFVYPLKLSSNRRYLVDQRNVPFMIVGDSPQALIGNLGVKDAAHYIANRKAAGFNTLWVNLLCAKYTGCRDDGTTFDGIKPFRNPGDLSTPNPPYFARADAIIRLAAKAGIVVLLDPIETGGWLNVLRKNGLAKDRAYGRFLGRRYKRFGNIVWMSGNDFQTWIKTEDDAVVLAVAQGIRSADPAHLQTVELDYLDSGSRDDPRWGSLISLSAAYTYYPTYGRVLREHNYKPPLPVFMVEAGYEFEQNSSSISKGDPPILRRQEYWSILSGATGQLYGNHYTWQFAEGWKDHLDTRGSVQIGYLVKLFAGRRWFRLVPDQAHRIVTAGYGNFTTSGTVASSNYVTTAFTRDGTLAVSYLPVGGTVTVNMSRFAGRVQARWYDPSKGTYASVAGSPFPRSRQVRLTTPGKNGDGDRDWVLVLTAR